MIIDAHTHIFPDHMRQNRCLYFDNEPEFRLLYDSPKSAMAGCDDLIGAMDASGVELSVICGFPWHTPEYARANNDYVIACQEKYPTRLKGLACFDVMWKDAAEETRRCLDHGLCGVGELAFYLSGIDRTAVEALKPLMRLLLDRGNRPCMIHTNEPVGHPYPGKTPVTLKQIYNLAKAFPDNRIILAHWGGGLLFYNIMKKEVASVLKNIWFDTAASPFLYTPDIYPMAVLAGMIDKIVLGTDFPLLTVDRYLKEMDVSGISPEHRAKITHENARRAYF